MDFGEALKEMKMGYAVRRKGWPGKMDFIEILQFKEKNSKMTEPYIFLDCISSNGENKRVPWTPSQIDILAEDWFVY